MKYYSPKQIIKTTYTQRLKPDKPTVNKQKTVALEKVDPEANV